jgi:Ca2+-binding RTX toxin-like protein
MPMTNSPHLALPYLEAAQAQKHVTHNEALRALDAVVMLAVLDRDLTAPPASPSEGDRYLIASAATGLWSGKDGQIAAWQDGAWSFYPPQEGWRLWVADEDILLVFNGASWTGAATQNAALLGVNTSADATNKLAVSSAAVLFTHAGNGVQVKLNKSGDSDTASFLFQKGYSGRAEIGLIGSNDFAFKTSPDGSVFDTGLTLVAAANGVPRIPGLTVSALPTASTAGSGALAFVSDESGGGVLAFCDGTDWRRVTDRAIVT